jgi:hypothetical protein
MLQLFVYFFSFEFVCVRESTSILLNDLAGEPDASLDRSLKILTKGQLRKESANK